MSHRFRLLDRHHRYEEFLDRCAFAVMAKVPTAGKVKTRLSPPLTPAQAAALNADFLRDTLGNLALAASRCAASCVVSYTPAGCESAFNTILPDGTLLLPQRGDGFGERLFATATDLFACGFSAVCLIDSDSPTVPTVEFTAAADLLLPSRGRVSECAVLGRSDDGGYYLLGLTQPHAHLFEDISWSTNQVADQTEQRAAEIGLPLRLLSTWYDVDEAASLARLCDELDSSRGAAKSEGYFAPHTRAFLSRLAISDNAATNPPLAAHGPR